MSEQSKQNKRLNTESKNKTKAKRLKYDRALIDNVNHQVKSIVNIKWNNKLLFSNKDEVQWKICKQKECCNKKSQIKEKLNDLNIIEC